jgi:ribonuclease Z
VRFVLFTHFHQDHYLALPQLLFRRWMKAGADAPPLTVAGPAADVQRIVDLTRAFLQVDRFGGHTPLTVLPLASGDRFVAEGLEVSVAATRHPVPSLCYRLCEIETGATLAWTGDTAFHEPLVEHVRGVDLLVHEASYGPAAMAGLDDKWGHSGSPDAARLAKEAGVKRLALVHGEPGEREAAVDAARAVFAETFWPVVGERIVLP